MPAKVILNPYSGRWNAQKRWPEAEAALHAAGVAFELSVSEQPQGTVALAAQAVRDGFTPVIAAGGDGTIGDVVNGLASVRSEHDLGVMGILPLGTANDLVANLGLPSDLGAAARVIAAGKSRLIDVGRVNDLYFANNSAIGLEPYVTQKQIAIKRIKGILRYLVAAVQGILDLPTWQAALEWDDGQYEGPLTLVSVGNGSRTGGLFYMTPHADPSDGKLTFTYAYRATRASTFSLLPKAMNPKGDFVQAPGVYEIDSAWLKIRLNRPSPAHTDGELFSSRVMELEYRIIPACLHVLA